MAVSTKNFDIKEFACEKCVCGGENGILQTTIDLAQKIRDRIQAPMIITSGYRCFKKNDMLRKAGKAASNSGHLTGEAFDFCVKGMNSSVLQQIIKQMYEEGLIDEITYCYKISPTAVHVGVDRKKRRQIFA